ncbi:hypothetical protein ACFL16_00260 [Patescibacteria group bacterium]
MDNNTNLNKQSDVANDANSTFEPIIRTMQDDLSTAPPASSAKQSAKIELEPKKSQRKIWQCQVGWE